VGQLSSDAAASAEYARHIERVRPKTRKETSERACNLRENRKLNCSYATHSEVPTCVWESCIVAESLLPRSQREAQERKLPHMVPPAAGAFFSCPPSPGA